MSNTYKDDPAKGLSELQKYLLLVLVRQWGLDASGDPWFSSDLGVPWNPGKRSWHYGGVWFQDLTRVEAACFSRALARLEKRGLVIRQNMYRRLRKSAAEPFKGKTTHVFVTELGFTIARRISRKQLTK